jgi:hypothetical protein
MEIPKEIINDARYLDIGDLPTGYAPYKELGLKQIYLRPFVVKELPLIHLGSKAKVGGLSSILRAVNMVASCDIYCLTDGDFEFLLAWLRRNSYPTSPMLVSWICKKTNVVEKETRKFILEQEAKYLTETDMRIHNYEYELCDAENSTIVHNAKVLVDTLDDDCLYIKYDDIDFARVNTLVEYDTLIESDPSISKVADLARWVKAGNTLAEKIEILESSDIDLYERIVETQNMFKHGIRESMSMQCRVCRNKVEHTSKPNLRSFFSDNTETDIYNIQYGLMSEFGVAPDDDMPIKKLLYHHSCLAKDKQDEKERNAQQAAANKVRRPTYNHNR